MPGRSHVIFLFACWMILLPAIGHSSGVDSTRAEKSDSGKTAFQPEASPDIRRSKVREIRNYIRPTVSFSVFSTGTGGIRTITPTPALDQRLGKYAFFQSSLSFYAPLYTKTKFYGADSTRIKTFQLLFTINALTDRPTFTGLQKQHELYKLAIGVRGIWTKKRTVIFTDFTPFVTGDKYNDQQTTRLRLGTTFVANFTLRPKFSWRIGITKTFIYGNKLFLPMIGFRYGRLDGPAYIQVQFPRHVSFTIQPSSKFSISIYSKAHGGVYNISNGDSLYPFQSDSVIHFGRLGIANGIKLEFRPNPALNFYVGGGFAMRNYIWLYSYSYNQHNNLEPFTPFYEGQPARTFFINFGVSVRFGKAKRSQGNYVMYDAFDLNNQMDPGDNGNGTGNGDIPRAAEEKDIQNVQIKDVEDLVDETDLY